MVGLVHGELTETEIADIRFLSGIKETADFVLGEDVAFDCYHLMVLGACLSDKCCTRLALVIDRVEVPVLLFFTGPSV